MQNYGGAVKIVRTLMSKSLNGYLETIITCSVLIFHTHIFIFKNTFTMNTNSYHEKLWSVQHSILFSLIGLLAP